MPVDLYVGGAEHAVLHLLYARFWHKVLYELELVNTREPFVRLVNQGMILGEGGVKMSKSLGNVINPDDIIRDYGADSMRLYEMFMGPLQSTKPWSTSGISGVHRFLDRVWRVSEREINDRNPPEELMKVLHQTIKKVSLDTDGLEFNTAIAQMMIFVNEAFKHEGVYRNVWEQFITILSPYAPHIAEEIWQEKLGKSTSIMKAEWPEWNEELIVEDVVTIVIQINGKLRDRIEMKKDSDEESVKKKALSREKIQEYTSGKEIRKIIYVPNRLLNIVVS
jgi:leucyl-tRNA synthetase